MTIKKVMKKNTAAIEAEIDQLGKDVTYELVSELIPELIAKNKLILELAPYTPFNDSQTGVGRYLIYDHPDKENPFSIWIFAFAPRQKTSIHDHLYKGTVMVLNEPISEKFYLPTSEQKAKIIDRVDRFRFHKNTDDLKGDFVHQLKRRKGLGEGISLTLHVYNMEAYRIDEDNKAVDRRNLKQIYCKDRIFDKTHPASYRKECSDWDGQSCSF